MSGHSAGKYSEHPTAANQGLEGIYLNRFRAASMEEADIKAKNYNVKKGVIFILLAGVGFSMMTFFVRISGDIPTFQKAFFRNIVAAVLMLALMIKKGEVRKLNIDRENRLPLFLRCSAGTLGIICNFWAIDQIGLADANMLNKMSPFFSIIFAVFILKDIPRYIDIICVICAIMGSALVVKPGSSLFQIGSLVGFIGGMAAGLAYTYVRKLGMNNVPGEVIVVSFSLFSSIVCIPFIIMDHAVMTFTQIVTLLCAGGFAAMGQMCITKAYTYAPPKEISIYDYSQVIYAALLGFIFFSEVPDIYSVAGYAVIIGAAILRWKTHRHG